MKFLNSDIVPILTTLLVYNDNTKMESSGLLIESMQLSLRRRLQKIRTDTLVHYEQLVKDEKNLREMAKPETLEEELKILFAEEIEINQEYASLAMIEAIETKSNYNFETIEKFAR